MKFSDLTNEQIKDISDSLPSAFKLFRSETWDGAVILSSTGENVIVNTLEQVFIKISDYNYEEGKKFVRRKLQEALGR